ncbi:MAG: SDR family oxidoreductase [Tateyamaria sp.]|uniref:SDR family oxidoreductase n=1 Tax=Tateyamaria sp. TaxID=1929288 RepID=UPI00329AA48C
MGRDPVDALCDLLGRGTVLTTHHVRESAMTRALVTGAGHRLGQAMAIYLAGRGYDVAVHYASSDKGALETVAQIEAKGQRGVALQADLLDEDATQALFGRAVEALGGPITCLVNNASIFEYDTIETATRETWDKHMHSNLRAPFVLTQAMADQGLTATRDDMDEPVAAGLILNMCDQRVRKLTPEFMTYTLAKMGLWALTQTSARALTPTIRVNAIGPGPTLQGGRQSAEHFAAQRAATVLQRGSNPSDIVAALGYFLDAPAVTGQLLCVDGGQHLGWETPDVVGVE